MTKRITSRPALEPLETRIALASAAAGVIDLGLLDGASGFVLQGEGENDNLGDSVRPIGDFNGDGITDFAVGLDQADRDSENAGPGRLAVIFGTGSVFPKSIKLGDLNGTNGFVINGTVDEGAFGDSIAGGDFNGDGLSDLATGAPSTNFNGSISGSIYVFYGSSGPFPAEMDAIVDGTNGFRVDGFSGSGLGRLGAAGDINGDGADDLIAGAVLSDASANNGGSVYVVFGRTRIVPAAQSVTGLNGVNGFRINGTANEDRFGESLTSGFDLNADGIDDLAIGAAGEDLSSLGKAFVLFGKNTPFGASMEATALTDTTGISMTSAETRRLGRDVRAAGDINGDNVDDLIVGSSGDRAYVLYGRSGGDFASPLNLDALNGANGFRLTSSEGGFFGSRVSGLGDFNGDGFDDLAVGASGTSVGKNDAGAAYVVFGRPSPFPATFNVAEMTPDQGFRIYGLQSGGNLGFDMSGIGDLNGDGLADLSVGASDEKANGKNGAGNSYVIFGFNERLIPTKKGVSFVEADGDIVSLSLKGARLVPQDISFNMDGTVAEIDLTRLAPDVVFAGKTKSLDFKMVVKTPKNGGGDGVSKVDKLTGTGVKFGKVFLEGGLGELIAGDGTTVAKSIKIKGGLGPDDGAAVESKLDGKVGSLQVDGDIRDVLLDMETVAKIKVGGGIFNSQVRMDGSLASLLVGGNVEDSTISARGTLDPQKASAATALKNAVVNGDFVRSRLLAGYDSTGAAVNADAAIGNVRIDGNLEASSLVAGATAGLNGFFGDGDDALIPGGNQVVARVASITIKGTVLGSAAAGDHFGIVAEEIGKLSIDNVSVSLTPGPGNDTVPAALGGTTDVKVREVFLPI